MSDQFNYRRAAFIAYEPGGYPQKKRVIPFRFNPEALSRSLAVEQGQKPEGTEGAKKKKGGDEQSSDSSSGTLKQTFNVLVRFDYTDRLESSGELSEELGVGPEIAALEDLMYPAEADSAHKDDGSEPVKSRAPRPTVLFVWGRKRVWPVRITGMTINETVFNTELHPVRAEVDVALEVLSDADAKDNKAVQTALSFTDKNRRDWAKLFLDRTATQTTDHPDFLK